MYVPFDLLYQIFDFSMMYGVDVLTVIFGIVGIYLISKGSAEYGNLQHVISQEEEQKTVQGASSKVLFGGFSMAATAYLAQNPLFAIPEIAAVVTSFKPFLTSRSGEVASAFIRIRVHLLLIGLSTILGIYTIVQHAQDMWDTLPPMGLTCLSCAFALAGDKTREWVYRTLTLIGGIAMIVGSAYALSETYEQGDMAGSVMSCVFFILNGQFTVNELLSTVHLCRAKNVACTKSNMVSR